MEIFILIFLSYISGSIPFGLILTNIFTKKDIRNIGSGNIGATNVLRSGEKILAAFTLILDVLKGFIPVIISQKFYPEFVNLTALLAFLGHLFPIWIKFKGGKGVATYLGIIFALSYMLGVLFVFTWIVISLTFRYSSVSSIFSAMTVFVVTFIREVAKNSLGLNDPNNYVQDNSIILFIFFILIVFTHRKNIKNLKNKNESKLKL